ncbi:hypothetical protein C8N32_10982 [Rhodovulum imhoffii]|uniref:Uncharacterized protein n=1 Tax=Rhodovulum imhoffii TaxID=365340 RepID=A0A2T5BRP5_9RHOB|nr:hypothetical protein [Rhodovulum imhoffii]MBK5934073.1 hypothetical protein [Rhodovulum imhoffii]PTN01958.1 hypothetical protein C8N32_10982 [Rhodovulum imhoffii]
MSHSKSVLAVVILAILIAFPARPEQVRVLSGDHPTFSRLVFLFDDPIKWELGRTAEGYLLRFDREDFEADLSRVFRLITRTRLQGVEKTVGPELRLKVDGMHHAHAFDYRRGVVVIDIRDGAPGPGARFEVPLSSQPAVSLPPPSARRPPINLIEPFLPEPKSEPSSAAMSAFARQMAREIGRAASEGLLEPADELPAPVSAPPDLDAGRNIRVRSSLERDRLAALPEAADGEACIENDKLALRDWGDARPIAEQLSATRALLLDGGDRPDSRAVETLVRLYLHLGFGAEARATLAQYDGLIEDAWLYATLAAALEGRPSPDAERMRRQMSCDGPVALWAVMAQTRLKPSDEIRVPAIRRAFSDLPPALRRQIGPALADRFLQVDDADTASFIRDSMERGAAGHAALALVDAKVKLESGQAGPAEGILNGVANTPGPEAPEALALLLEEKLQRDEKIEPLLLENALALAFELRREPLGSRLYRAVLQARAREGKFTEVFEQMRRHNLLADQALSDRVIAELARHGTDAQVLRYGLALTSRPDMPHPGGAVRAVLADRLRAIGFPKEASRLFSAPARVEPSQPTPLSDALSAWENQDWDRLKEIGSTEQKALADSYRTEDFVEDKPPLATARAKLERSVRTQEAVRALLEQTRQ